MRWIALLSLVLIAGCAAKQRVSDDPLGAAPTDFAIEMSILTGPLAPLSNEAHLRQSRYVLFADGSLYHGEDAERLNDADWLPPLTRVLTRRQVAELWSLAQRLGFTDPQNADAQRGDRGATNFKLVTPAPDGMTVLAGFSGWGERWTFMRAGPADQPDPAMTQLARELARLAWSSDEPAVAAGVMPKRYDFGPDPYARFRQAGGAPAAATAPAKPKDGKP